MIAVIVLALTLAGCDQPEIIPEPQPAPPPVVEQPVTTAPAVPPAVVAKKIRAALDRAVPREAVVVAASPDKDSVDLVRLLHRNVEHALADLEADGGRHMTPAKIQRAATAVKDLQNHLAEFQPSDPP